MRIDPSWGYKVAFPTDEHFPFQDEDARSIALQIVRDFDPDALISGSDGVDFYSVSKYDKNPKRKVTLQHEIDLWAAGQREWADAAPNARRFFIPGNHEDRLRRYLWRHPEMSGLEALSLHNLMGLDSMGIEYNERVLGENYGHSEIEIGPLVIKHGTLVRRHSAYTARGEMEREFYNVPVLLTGHTHRAGSHYASTRDGMVRAYECFCLCDMNPSYVHRPNWQHGLVIATIYGTLVQVEPIPFFDSAGQKTAVWRDEVYTA